MRGSRASLGALEGTAGQPTGFLYPPPPPLLQAAKVAETGGGNPAFLLQASWVHRPKRCPSTAENCSLAAQCSGPRGWSRPCVLQGLGPRPCSSRLSCVTLSRWAAFAAFIFSSVSWVKLQYHLPGWWGGRVESGLGEGEASQTRERQPHSPPLDLLPPSFSRQSPGTVS